MKIRLSEPVVVAMGPISAQSKWGPYQFPAIYRLEDGRLIYTFCDAADSEAAYNAELGCRVSADGGKTWTAARERDFSDLLGIRATNGDLVRFEGLSSIPLENVSLPEPIGCTALGHTIYRVEDLKNPTFPLTWRLYRRADGEKSATLEDVTLNWPHMIVRSTQGVFVPPSVRGRLRKAPDDTLWMPHYYLAGTDPESGELIPYLCNYLFRSTDCGRTWELMHFLPYFPDGKLRQEHYEGYGENDVAFCPDGSMIRLIRLSSVAPCMLTRSADGGKTWSEPQIFDTHGVWPCLLTLKCGVTLASYGRPGLTLRATDDPSCQAWEDPIELIHAPAFDQGGDLNSLEEVATCGYSSMIPLDDRTAALAYSNFTIRDRDGISHKCMMFRTVHID